MWHDGHVAMSSELAEKCERLATGLAELQSVVVAFSGGADSTFLAVAARRVLGREQSHCVTAVSPSLAQREEHDCRELAVLLDLRWTPVTTFEMERAAYRVNDTDRCYHCKAELMDVVAPLALADGATVILGVNCDDLSDHRPGQTAARERGAVFPLVDAGFSKSDVRAVSHHWDLPTWNKPAAACLASRIPYGTPVSVEILSRVDRAEAAIVQAGFSTVRVRHYGETARLELAVEELAAAVAQRDLIVSAVKSAGYRYVTLDLEGFRSGNLNGGTVVSSSEASERP